MEEEKDENDEELLDDDELYDLQEEDQNSRPSDISSNMILEKIDNSSKYRIKKIPC